jgi:hypothetical protein
MDLPYLNSGVGYRVSPIIRGVIRPKYGQSLWAPPHVNNEKYSKIINGSITKTDVPNQQAARNNLKKYFKLF